MKEISGLGQEARYTRHAAVQEGSYPGRFERGETSCWLVESKRGTVAPVTAAPIRGPEPVAPSLPPQSNPSD